MSSDNQKIPRPLGLLATGSSEIWDISLEETISGHDAWFLEIENRGIYLTFQLLRLDSVSDLLRFLDTHFSDATEITPGNWDEESHALTVGTFGPDPVQFVWDNEGFARCFIVLGSHTSTLRWSVHQEEIASLIEALQQVVEELSLPETSP
jgi:hypothetical protein